MCCDFSEKNEIFAPCAILDPFDSCPAAWKVYRSRGVCLGFFLGSSCAACQNRVVFVLFSCSFRAVFVVRSLFNVVFSRFVSRSSLGVRYKNQCKNVIFSGFARASFAAAWGCGVSPGYEFHTINVTFNVTYVTSTNAVL